MFGGNATGLAAFTDMLVTALVLCKSGILPPLPSTALYPATEHLPWATVSLQPQPRHIHTSRHVPHGLPPACHEP